MHEADSRKPAWPNRITRRRLTWAWIRKPFQRHLRRFERDENEQHYRCEEVSYEDQIEGNEIGKHNRGHRYKARGRLTYQNRQCPNFLDSIFFELVCVLA